MKKNLILLSFSLLASIVIIYLLVFAWVVILEKYKRPHNFTNSDTMNFHKKYSNQLHHVRGKYWPHQSLSDLKSEDYLFTKTENFSKNKRKNILIQGASWAEYLIYKKKSKAVVRETIEKNNIGLINSGTSSYSPTPMYLQFKILTKDFQIKPDFVLVLIDQTDIGDELCRYRKNIVEDKNGIKRIKKELNSGAAFDYSKYYEISEILIHDKKLKSFHITNYYFKKFFFENKFKNNKCKFDDITKYLYDLDLGDKIYFKKRLKNYIDYLSSVHYLEKVFIVTFPHQKHISNEYKTNMSDIINEMNFSDKIVHINFTDIIDKGEFPSKDIFEINDPASHLTDHFQALYISKVFQIIEDYL